MSVTLNKISEEVARRRTFAIISHPDAGKTTLTEKLLLYGGAINQAGAVKARRAERHATSDWMELEKQRGISVTSSVMQFEYAGHKINVLDTPGHQDFSEDTYRTLTAADSAVMLIDCAKGVEAQTMKLFKVCRMSGIPIFTFVNKLDREGREPLELLAEIEEVLGIAACPVNWPLGMGKRFKGVYDLTRREVHLYDSTRHGKYQAPSKLVGPTDPTLRELLFEEDYKNFQDEIELLEGAGEKFDLDRILAGELTPVFFGSAMKNFGVEPFLRDFLKNSPQPSGRYTEEGRIEPVSADFTGFVFKIQANMNPQHRDRVAFIRVTSGHFSKGLKATNARLGKEVTLALPMQFMAQERDHVEEAYPGDVIGIHDRGTLRIGDTLYTGKPILLKGIPHFVPEHFAKVRIKNALKSKQRQKGLQQLGEEGAIQLFSEPTGDPDPIVGAVGQLQLDVLKYRLEHEYGAVVTLEKLPYQTARWVEGKLDPAVVNRSATTRWVVDNEERPVVLFNSEWAVGLLADRHKGVTFRESAY
ncbi:MAG: peptide chain release factor 3 [Deltaproteobacteria bacterium]|nr:MAG: peptide chain release factor 3 [Deltaproteobacteria bacterium]